MNTANVERLVSELLARGDMNPDTIADLERIVGEARAGAAQPDDVDYLAALHARLFAADNGVPEHAAVVKADALDDLRTENQRLRAELDAAHNTIAELEERLASQG